MTCSLMLCNPNYRHFYRKSKRYYNRRYTKAQSRIAAKQRYYISMRTMLSSTTSLMLIHVSSFSPPQKIRLSDTYSSLYHESSLVSESVYTSKHIYCLVVVSLVMSLVYEILQSNVCSCSANPSTVKECQIFSSVKLMPGYFLLPYLKGK